MAVTLTTVWRLQMRPAVEKWREWRGWEQIKCAHQTDHDYSSHLYCRCQLLEESRGTACVRSTAHVRTRKLTNACASIESSECHQSQSVRQ
jgi:hypothetical protein